MSDDMKKYGNPIAVPERLPADDEGRRILTPVNEALKKTGGEFTPEMYRDFIDAMFSAGLAFHTGFPPNPERPADPVRQEQFSAALRKKSEDVSDSDPHLSRLTAELAKRLDRNGGGA